MIEAEQYPDNQNNQCFTSNEEFPQLNVSNSFIKPSENKGEEVENEASKSTESSENSNETVLANEHLAEATSSDNQPKEDEWLDIMGTGKFKKKVLRPGLGPDTRPQRGDKVIVSITFYIDGNIYEEIENFSLIVGDIDVIQGLDLVICLMENEEKAKVLIPSKLAYGKTGKLPEVPPDTDIECDIEIKETHLLDLEALSLSESMQYGDEKRCRGNYFYERGEHIEAIHCYERAAEFLDSIHNSSGTSPEESQKVVDLRIKIHNNMAATHLKLSAFSAALKSVEAVLKVQPANVKALFRKAKILSSEGRTDEAISCMRIAAKLDPDTKAIQAELSKLLQKQRKERESQKAMYQRMFNQSPPKKSSRSFSRMLKWGALTGGVLAMAAGMAVYRQLHS